MRGTNNLVVVSGCLLYSLEVIRPSLYFADDIVFDGAEPAEVKHGPEVRPAVVSPDEILYELDERGRLLSSSAEKVVNLPPKEKDRS